MQIHNIKVGFTTNSSSSHSIVIIPGEGVSVKDWMEGGSVTDLSFWCNDFVLASPAAKGLYLAAQLYQHVEDDLGGEISLLVIKEILGVDLKAVYQQSIESFVSYEEYKKAEELRFFGTEYPQTWTEEDKKADEVSVKQSYEREKSESFLEWFYGSTCIDHQSQWSLPKDFNCGAIDLEFLKELNGFIISNEDVVILGGSDESDTQPYRERTKEEIKERIEETKRIKNKEGKHWEYYDIFPWGPEVLEAGGKSKELTLPLPEDCSGYVDLVCRKDKNYNYWTIFDRYNGGTVRFSFNYVALQEGKGEEITRSTVPEVIDLCITTKCPYDCPWCYMASDCNGHHADYYDIWDLAKHFSEDRVFEIGWGEPTLHPKFLEILEMFRGKGVVPSFSTRNLAWLNDGKFSARVFSSIGGWAYTVRDHKEISTLNALLTLQGYNHEDKWRDKAVLHYVLGTYDQSSSLMLILEEAFKHNMNITLLGFKDQGRGGKALQGFNGRRMSEIEGGWLKTIQCLYKAKQCPRIGVDSSIVTKFEKELQESEEPKIPKILHCESDGNFSMFVDAVNERYGESSFCPKDKMFSIDTTSKGKREFSLQEAFAKVQANL